MLEESEINDFDHGSTQNVGRQGEQVGLNPIKFCEFDFNLQGKDLDGISITPGMAREEDTKIKFKGGCRKVYDRGQFQAELKTILKMLKVVSKVWVVGPKELNIHTNHIERPNEVIITFP